VFVYQTGSYRHWAERLDRHDLVHGQFGENFTVDGLADDQVCIGDRYRIGSALFEVTQPRVTCYRVGIRTDNPQMAALLTSSGRPGFYFRVIEEGEVGAGDTIERVFEEPLRMTVSAINALLYAPPHPKAELERALQIAALPSGWRQSFEALAKADESAPGARGNVGLAPPAATGAAPGFRAMRVASVAREADDIVSLDLRPADGESVSKPLPGQYVVLRLRPDPNAPALYRSYSLSGAPSCDAYRISIKIEPHGAGGAFLGAHIHADDRIEVSLPRGAFTLRPADRPIVLLSAGIGITPVLAMLHALADSATSQPVWWLHATRSGVSHVFSSEVRQALGGLAQGRSFVWFTRPGSEDRQGRDFDAVGRPSVAEFAAIDVPRDADFYLCGPIPFIADLTGGLLDWGVPRERIFSELFGSAPTTNPGIVHASTRAPHLPDGPAGSGPLVSFARSGITVRWRATDQSLLELAEACDVPVRWSCRAGICHQCESGLVSGAVNYQPDPLDLPADGNLLLCCGRPRQDVVIDI
jgi:ferredoxin-NADP reductase/MOSC domain-containing protein YiiM